MRHTRSHTKNRRSHHALKEPALSKCVNCGELHRPHHMCLSCGHYKGRQVMDLETKRKEREARMEAKREHMSAEMAEAAPEATPEVLEETKETPKEETSKKATEKNTEDKKPEEKPE